MSRNRYVVVVAAFVMVSLFSSPGFGQANTFAQGNAAAIKLKAATFSPGRGQAPAIPPGLAIAGYPEGQRGYYLVQFQGPVEQAWKDSIAAEGAELLDYVPEFAFKVRMNPAEARRVARLSGVTWVGPLKGFQ